MKIELGPIRPEWAVEPGPNVRPIYPPPALLIGMTCPLCGAPLVNGTAIAVCDKGLAHARGAAGRLRAPGCSTPAPPPRTKSLRQRSVE